MGRQEICPLSGKMFGISDQEIELLKKMELKEPIYAPKIRNAMRLAFRNERSLYIRKCDFSGERILSMYHNNHPFPVYKFDYWLSDQWATPTLEYDPAEDFFSQYKELQKKTPRPNLFAPYNENCDYVNAAEKNKNCYMIYVSDRCEDCYYLHTSFNCRDCLDSAYLINSELCYECTDCRSLYHCRMCFLCDNSSELSFCFDMKGCSDCFLCFGLRNQKYYIQNQPFTKEEYEKKMAQIDFRSPIVFNHLKQKFFKEIVEERSYVRMLNTENCDGNFLINCKDCHHCYDLEEAEDCRYLRVGSNHVKDVIDSHAIVDGSELIYGNVSTTESYNCHNVIGCWTTKNSAYSEFLQGCEDCFGCISLRHKKHCILNKQYTKDEYETIKGQIISQLGAYYGSPFPFKIAPFSYQDSAFRDYDSLNKEEVEKIGWSFGERRIMGVDKPYKTIPQEEKLLNRIQAPLPDKHHDIRFEERVSFRKRATA